MNKEQKISIYYTSSHDVDDELRHPYRFCNLDTELTDKDVEKYYRKLPNWVIDDLSNVLVVGDIESASDEIELANRIFSSMNQYQQNPLSPDFHKTWRGVFDMKGQEWLEQNEVHHTSMSVGDMICFEQSIDSTDGPVDVRRYLYCQSVGWAVIDMV